MSGLAVSSKETKALVLSLAVILSLRSKKQSKMDPEDEDANISELHLLISVKQNVKIAELRPTFLALLGIKNRFWVQNP